MSPKNLIKESETDMTDEIKQSYTKEETEKFFKAISENWLLYIILDECYRDDLRFFKRAFVGMTHDDRALKFSKLGYVLKNHWEVIYTPTSERIKALLGPEFNVNADLNTIESIDIKAATKAIEDAMAMERPGPTKHVRTPLQSMGMEQ